MYHKQKANIKQQNKIIHVPIDDLLTRVEAEEGLWYKTVNILSQKLLFQDLPASLLTRILLFFDIV